VALSVLSMMACLGMADDGAGSPLHEASLRGSIGGVVHWQWRICQGSDGDTIQAVLEKMEMWSAR
jgi:hypothetical protein